MSEEKKEEKIRGRRTFLATAAGTIVGAVVTGVGVWALTPKEAVPVEVTKTVTAPGATVTTTAGAVTTTSTVTAPGVTKEVTVTAPAVAGERLVEFPEPSTPDARALYHAKLLAPNVPKGTKIRVVVAEGTADQFEWMHDTWDNFVGVSFELIPIPFGELAKKATTELVTKEGAYDLITTPDEYIGDFVEGGLVYDITPLIEKYRPELFDWPCPYSADYQKCARYMDKDYQFIWDGCLHTYFYRTDYLNDPKEQEEFEARYHYPLPTQGAETWEQFRDMLEFFDRPEEPGGKNEKLTGLPGIRGAYIMFTRWEICAHHYIRLLDKGGLPFDDDMNCMLNSPESVAALEDMKKIVPFMPEIAISGTWTEFFTNFPAGKVFAGESWVSPAKYSVLGEIKGEFMQQRPPGYIVKGKLLRTSVRILTSSYFVSKYSPIPELSYLFLQYFMSPAVSAECISRIGYWDPSRTCHFDYPPVLAVYGKTPERAAVNMRNVRLNQAHMAPFIIFERSGEYIEKYNAALHAYITGVIGTAKEALNIVKEDWDKITESVGRDKQLKQWNYMKQYFPNDELSEYHGFVSKRPKPPAI